MVVMMIKGVCVGSKCVDRAETHMSTKDRRERKNKRHAVIILSQRVASATPRVSVHSDIVSYLADMPKNIPNFPKCCILWTFSRSKPAARPPSSPITVHHLKVSCSLTAVFPSWSPKPAASRPQGALTPEDVPISGNFPSVDLQRECHPSDRRLLVASSEQGRRHFYVTSSILSVPPSCWALLFLSLVQPLGTREECLRGFSGGRVFKFPVFSSLNVPNLRHFPLTSLLAASTHESDSKGKECMKHAVKQETD